MLEIRPNPAPEHGCHAVRKQNTVLDMASLVPALDDAFAAAGILLRPEVADARQAAQQTADEGVSAVSRRLQHVLSKSLPE